MPEKATLKPKQLRAIAALTTTGEVSAACKSVGVSRGQFYRWRQQPAFQEELQRAGQVALTELSTRLLALSGQAASALEASLQDDTPPAVRLRAAETVINAMLRLREALDIEQRVTALEIRIVEGEK